MKGDLKSIRYVRAVRRGRACDRNGRCDSRPAIWIFRTKTAFVSSPGGYAIWSTRMNEMAALPEANSPGLSGRDLVPFAHRQLLVFIVLMFRNCTTASG